MRSPSAASCASRLAKRLKRLRSSGLFAEEGSRVRKVEFRKVQARARLPIIGRFHLFGDLFRRGDGVVFHGPDTDLGVKDDGEEAILVDVHHEHAASVALLIDAAEIVFADE